MYQHMKWHVITALKVLFILNLFDFKPLLFFDLSNATLATWQISIVPTPIAVHLLLGFLLRPVKPRSIAAPEGRFALHVALDLFLLLTAFFTSLSTSTVPQSSLARRFTVDLQGLSNRRSVRRRTRAGLRLLAESIRLLLLDF
mgnify:CR=1 FL=1